MLERVEELILKITLLFFRYFLFVFIWGGNVQARNCAIKQQLLRYPFVGKGNLSGPAATKASSRNLDIASNSEFKFWAPGSPSVLSSVIIRTLGITNLCRS